MPQCSIERINSFQPEEKLGLAHEFQNPYDLQALILTTNDHHIVGYCPRYLNKEVFNLFHANPNSVNVRVERVNQSPAPLQFRLLCNLTAQYDLEFRPFSAPEYQPYNYSGSIGDKLAAIGRSHSHQ